MRVLLHLAAHAGEVVSVEQLLDEVWRGVVVTPNSVYHAVAELRRALGDDPKAPVYITNVQRRGYRLIAEVAPCPEEVLTGSAVPAPAANNSSGAGSPRFLPPRSAVGLGVAAALLGALLALGYFVGQRLARPTTSGAGQPQTSSHAAALRPSVAVLPFVDMSDTHDQQYFADGLAQELIDRLGMIPQLYVPARTSSFYFEGKQATIAEIASALGVANILEGSVRKSGNTLRISAQLVRADSGDHVWSQTFDRQLNDVFRIQDEIASAVAQVLKVSLLPHDAGHPDAVRDTEAYTLLLQARFYDYQLFNREGERKAVDYYEQVVHLDPGSAAGWEGLSRAVAELPRFGVMPWQQGRERALQAAERALAIDASLPASHIALGKVRYIFDLDWPGAQAEFDAARALDPRDTYAMLWSGLLAGTLGRPDESMRIFSQALLQDPLNYFVHQRVAAASFSSGRFADSVAAARRAVELSPTGSEGHALLAQALLAQGEPEAAVTEIERESDDGLRLCGRARIFRALGRSTAADEDLRRLEATYAHNMAYCIAEVRALRGEADQAFYWLNRAYDQRDMFLVFDGGVLADANLKQLRQDKRFRLFLQRMKLPE